MEEETIYQDYIEWLMGRIRENIIFEDNRIILHPLCIGEYLITRADYLPMDADLIEAELRVIGRPWYGAWMAEEDTLEDLEGRMKRGFRVGFSFIRRLISENEVLTKRVKTLEDQVKNLFRTGDN